MPALAAHDVGEVGDLLAELGYPAVSVRWYAGDHGAMIHAVRLPPMPPLAP